MSSLLRGAVIAGAVALAVVLSTAIGLSSPWPILLVAAVVLVRPLRPGPVVALVVGAAAWWVAMALRAGVLPDTTSSEVLAAVVAIAICTAAAVGTSERVPLWAGLAGSAVFAGLYEPVYADAPTHFLADSVVALASVVVAVGIGTVAAVIADLVEDRAQRVTVLPTTERAS